MSSYHIRALQRLRNVQVVGITDLDPIRGARVASEFAIPFFDSTQEMYSQHPEVVHVLTPPSSHCRVAIEALERGCHVFVEKPMATSEEECDLMIQKAAEVQRILSVDHSAKFDPVVQKSLRLIDSGAIGDILSIDYFRSSEYPPYRGGLIPLPYQEGGYPFRDIGVHALYLTEAFLGEIRKLDIRYRTTGRDAHLLLDEWSALVQCDKGIGHFQLSWTSRPIQHMLSVHATRGSILLDLYLETCVINRKLPLPKPVEAMINATLTACSSTIQVGWNSLQVATGRAVRGPDIHRAIREFYLALSDGNAPPVSAAEGKRIVTWVEKTAREADAHKRQLISTSAEPKPASILVTGASGFLGQALLRALRHTGKPIRVLVHRQSVGDSESHPCVDTITGDLGDPETVDRAVRGVEVVYHAGAATGGSWANYECGTIWGTKNIVDSCVRHQIPKLVYVSSLSVLQYAGLPGRARLDESSPLERFPEKRGDYANSKLQAERIVTEAIRNRGLRAVVLRPGNIFGPGAESVPPYGVVAAGNHWVVMGNGNALLPLVYVDDVADGLRKAAECEEATGKIIELVDPEQISQREYLRYCQIKMPQLRIHYVPMSLLYGLAGALEALGMLLRRNVPLTIYRLRSIRPHLEFSGQVASQVLEWAPPLPIRKRLEQTFGVSQDR